MKDFQASLMQGFADINAMDAFFKAVDLKKLSAGYPCFVRLSMPAKYWKH